MMKYKISATFRLSESWLGQGLTIRVPSGGFEYDHDALFAAVKDDMFGPNGRARKSWVTYGTYTNSSSYPAWASDFIKPIK